MKTKDVNRITTTYGKEEYDGSSLEGLPGYMERNRDNIVYDIDKDIKKRTTNPKLQLHNVSGSSGNNITQTVENVNFPINYDMQNQQNNTQDFKVPIHL